MSGYVEAPQIAARAAELVGGDRAKSHGDKTENHEKIAAVWNGILMAAGKWSAPLTALDVANMMEGMKIARRYSGSFNVDDYVDGAGYAAVAGDIAGKAEEQRRITELWADAALEGGSDFPSRH